MRQRVGDTVIYKGQTRRIISIGRGTANTIVFDNGRGVMGFKFVESLQSPYTPSKSIAVLVNDDMSSTSVISDHANVLNAFRKMDETIITNSSQGTVGINKLKDTLSKPNSLGYLLLKSTQDLANQSLVTSAKIQELVNSTASSSRLIVVLGCVNTQTIDESGYNNNSSYSIICLNKKDGLHVSTSGRFGDRFLKWLNSRFEVGICGTIKDTIQEALDTVGLDKEQTDNEYTPVIFSSGDNMMNAPFA